MFGKIGRIFPSTGSEFSDENIYFEFSNLWIVAFTFWYLTVDRVNQKTVKRKHKMPQTDKQTSTYNFHDLNQDLDELYKRLKKEKFKNDEIEHLLQPIIAKLPGQRKSVYKIIRSILHKTILIIVFLIISIYLLTYWDTFYWHLTAVTRILMIKTLPYFDWRYLKNEACLVRRFFGHPDPTIAQSEEVFNCDLCESLSSFNQITYDLDHHIEDLIYKFIDIERPILVKGGIEHWIKKSPEEFIDQLINERDLSKSIPCKVSTNVDSLRGDDVDVGTLIKKSGYFDSFFMHFQNCEVQAMKLFRKYTYRPKVLPREMSPTTYNWLVWSNNHNATKFKKIDLVEKYTVIGQLFGNTALKLVPRKNCGSVCPILEGILPATHFLVLTSMWDVEYLQRDRGDNIAVILEVKG